MTITSIARYGMVMLHVPMAFHGFPPPKLTEPESMKVAVVPVGAALLRKPAGPGA